MRLLGVGGLLELRRVDLAPLVASLTRELAAKLGIAAPSISRAVLAQLAAHDWPGNVRELMNVLETALIVGGGRTLALPEQLARRPSRRGVEALRGPRFEAAVRDAIEQALRATRGKIYGVDGAAAHLGLKPGTLQSKMRKLGVDRSKFV
ncbi:MAG: hypothetical protein H0T89_00615 [Deltaproteobacteria bacterium]|nr:hypothetical protein [Deltaproteobacteria bacterium]MDQ3297930.1 hypothetical protein [Myxococcota bacterium]